MNTVKKITKGKLTKIKKKNTIKMTKYAALQKNHHFGDINSEPLSECMKHWRSDHVTTHDQL